MTEKWVVTLSTQYGCAMSCRFCDCPKVHFNGNASFEDLKKQLYSALAMFPDVKYAERLNIHFARMGEPVLNPAVFAFARWLYSGKREIAIDKGVRIETLHPVLTTCMPVMGGSRLLDKLLDWCEIKNEVYNGQAGLQLSINSTNENQRQDMFNGKVETLKNIAELGARLPDPVSRKYCLNFALCSDYEVDAGRLLRLFDPDKFMVKITPIHNNAACRENKIETVGGYQSYAPYAKVESDLVSAGFDVLVFVPSMDEEDGLVTCGNAILGGGELRV